MGSYRYDDLQLPRLEDFDVCPYLGFVASDVALIHRLGPYYESWNKLNSQLSALIASNRFKEQVRALPILRTDKLSSDAERRHAYLVLACFIQAYVFEDSQQLEGSIPPALSEPFLEICTYWGLQPILSLIGFSLWNWTIKEEFLVQTDDKPVTALQARDLFLQDLKNVDMRVSFTSTIDEKVFALVPALVEAEGGCLVASLLDALKAASSGAFDSVSSTLDFCIERLMAMSRHLQIIHEACDPEIFYHQIRQFNTGSRGMEGRGLQDGFVFQLEDGRQVTSKCVGTSAAQSSLFPFLDHMFGVEHKSLFLKEMKLYMPKKHRDFLEAVEKLPSLRYFIELHPENTNLLKRFEECVTHLREWRTKHIGLVTRYVMMPAKKHAGSEGVKGTGGALPIPFLKETRNETV